MHTAACRSSTVNHPVVSMDRWLAERKTLLAHEKELTHLRDQIARERRALPWVRIDKDYVLRRARGHGARSPSCSKAAASCWCSTSCSGPGWEQGCPSCSYMADHSDGMNVHLAHRDVTLVAISRAPLAEIERFRQRMGWQFKWVSSFGSDFNYDFHVSVHAGRTRQGQGLLQLRHDGLPGRRSARHQRVLQGRRGHRLPHLLDLSDAASK